MRPPIHKATIIPRGRALGMVMSLPEGDRYSTSKAKLVAQLAMAMGGRAAEEDHFWPRKGQQRRLRRYQDGHRPGPPHGHRMGHERDASA